MDGLILTEDYKHLSKGEIKSLADAFVLQVADSGDANPLELYIKIKRFELMVSSVIDGLKPMAMNEASKHGKTFEFIGAKCQLKNGYQTLNYEEDVVYLELKTKLGERKTLLDFAHKNKDVFFDNEGVEVPKVSVKNAMADIMTVSL